MSQSSRPSRALFHAFFLAIGNRISVCLEVTLRGQLRMHGLKMTDKFAKTNGDWNITDWKMTDIPCFL